MRTQHHYTSEQEIISVIDEAVRAMKTTEQEALYHKKMSEKHHKDSAKFTNGEAAFKLERANEEAEKYKKCLTRAARIEGKLGRLKNTLAAFRSGVLFGEDKSVVLEK